MKNYTTIESLYESALKKKNEIKQSIIKNEDRIKEIDLFINSVQADDSEMKIFSPRDINKKKYGERIRLETDEKEMLIERNENLFELIEDLDAQIEQFKNVLDENAPDDETDDDNNGSDVTTISDEDNADISDVDVSVTGESNNLQADDELTVNDAEVEALLEKLSEKLSDIKKSMELSTSIIYQDAGRAKTELDSSIKKLGDILDKLL